MHNRLRMDIGCARSMTGGALVAHSVYIMMHSSRTVYIMMHLSRAVLI